MAFTLVCVVAFGASLLTFFTGFGLGTLLLPAFAAFFSVEIAVALTAAVHLLNNVFKLLLVGRRASLPEATRFGIPAVLAAFCGAFVLTWLADKPALWSYQIAGRRFHVEATALVIAVLMVLFVALELSPRFKRVSIPPRYLPLGGLLAGFFGGLSGHQGALRSAFLIRAGLDKEAFIATGVVIAVSVDIARLFVYSGRLLTEELVRNGRLLGAATAAAFLGALLGRHWLERVSLLLIERSVAVLLLLVAIGLASGAL